ncbi:MAG: hypothetical protein IPM38_09170 [Ignavibacteria bacterium]|nr:hypothetical protein [Ignavibacteria bacterium]
MISEFFLRRICISRSAVRNKVHKSKSILSSLYYLTPKNFLDGTFKEKLEVRESKLRQAKENRIQTRKAV